MGHPLLSIYEETAYPSHNESLGYDTKTFVTYATHLWNKLPSNIKNINDLDAFTWKDLSDHSNESIKFKKLPENCQSSFPLEESHNTHKVGKLPVEIRTQLKHHSLNQVHETVSSAKILAGLQQHLLKIITLD